MSNLDILLINIGGTRKKVYQDLSKDFSAIDTPFWAALTAGFIRKNGFSVDILDANAENLDFDETVERIIDKGPRFIGIICYSQQANVSTPIMVGVRELCRKIKKKISDTNVILTGWHPSALPERTLREEECDFVAEGEGFFTILGLLQDLRLEAIPGLWWKSNGEIHHNQRGENVQDLTDELSDVAWDLLPLKKDKYRGFNWMCLEDLQSRNRFVSMYTSLGCPFKCNFCAIHATYGEHKLRCWSPEWVLDQIDVLVNQYDVKNINLHDELFIFKRNHYLPIAEGIIERGYDLNICAFARIDVVDQVPKEDLHMLKTAGFNWFKIGIENANSEILQNCIKGQFTRETIRRVVNKIHASGIDICANFMFGLPGDTMERMQANLEFAVELKCAFPSFFCTMAIPGSSLYNEALEKGIPLPDTWLGYASQGYDFFPLSTEELTSEQVLRFRDEAFNTYFRNPEYLDMIERKFEIVAREHIQGMTSIKLRRKILGD
jgi:anaerobic magnesium-protoporphyrin IX monomethyl ester cyclase